MVSLSRSWGKQLDGSMVAIPLLGYLHHPIVCAGYYCNPKWGLCDAEVLKWDITPYVIVIVPYVIVPYVIVILVQSDLNPLDTLCADLYLPFRWFAPRTSRSSRASQVRLWLAMFTRSILYHLKKFFKKKTPPSSNKKPFMEKGKGLDLKKWVCLKDRARQNPMVYWHCPY